MDCFYKKEMDEKDLKLIKEKIKRLNSKHIFNLSNVRLLLMIIITALLWIVLLKAVTDDYYYSIIMDCAVKARHCKTKMVR